MFAVPVAAALASVFVVLALPEHAAETRAAESSEPVNALGAAPTTPVLPRAEVTISPGIRTISIPPSFVGLSTEYWALPRYEHQQAIFERILSLIQGGGAQPLVLRIGGDSADRTYWDPTSRQLPARFFELTPAWLRGVSTLVRRARLRLILDLNLKAGSPQLAAQWARAALASLPRGSVVGFEIGNEPDLYHRWPGYRLMRIGRTGPAVTVRSSHYSASNYVHEFRSYARALERVVPHVPLLGPALANPQLDVKWLSTLVARERAALGLVSAHWYPLSACAQPTSARYPTIARMLSEQASAGAGRMVKAAVRVAHRAGLPLRLTELNSVTCGGLRGVSETLASALWAPDALFELVRSGADGVNVHIRATTINAPFSLTASGLEARPLLYGLILFGRTLGPHAQLVHLRLQSGPALHLKVWAVRVLGGGLHVLVINKSQHSLSVHLHVPAVGAAPVERLLGPSPGARSGVTLDGQQLGHDGGWQGQSLGQAITPGADGYELTMPGLSAALVSLRPVRTVTGSRARPVRSPGRTASRCSLHDLTFSSRGPGWSIGCEL